MLLLTSPSDKLQVVTSNAGSIDVHASWMDNMAGSVLPGRTNTPTIPAPGTTDVVPSPGGGVQRNIKTLTVRNRGTANNDITIQHTDGSITVQMHKVTLGPEATVQYIDEIGFGFALPASIQTTKAVTSQTFTSGSGTYTTPAGVLWLDITLTGGGAGGSGGGAGGNGFGSPGGDSTFGTLNAKGAAANTAFDWSGPGGTGLGGNVFNLTGGRGGSVGGTTLES